MGVAAASHRPQPRVGTHPLVVPLVRSRFFRSRSPCVVPVQAKPGFGRAARHPGGAADNYSTKKPRKPLQTREPVPLSSDQCVPEANAFQLFHSFFSTEYLGINTG